MQNTAKISRAICSELRPLLLKAVKEHSEAMAYAWAAANNCAIVSLEPTGALDAAGKGGRYPKFLKGLAQYLHIEKGLERMQVQHAVQQVTGICIPKETLKSWLYKKSEQIE
jgi:hypothetical protein